MTNIMKKRIGVITLFDLNNFGNRLQNYAVIDVFHQMGFEADTLNVCRGGILHILKNKIKYVVKKLKKDRFAKFYQFSKKYTNVKDISCRNDSSLKRALRGYDYYSVGSDQVWNSKYLNSDDKTSVLEERLLTFAPGPQRFSFAASFSLDDIPEEDKLVFADALRDFSLITVREQKGKEIIQNLLPSKDVNVVLDPTLLLTADRWKDTMSHDFADMGEYAVEVFICPRSSFASEQIDKLIDAKCKRISVYDDSILRGGIGPQQFLELISKARYVFTDSFHAAVFSIIFQKEFYVFERSDNSQKSDSRFATLFDTLHMDSRLVHNGEAIEAVAAKTIDYESVTNLLERERAKSLNIICSFFQK